MKYLNIKVKTNIQTKIAFHELVQSFHNMTIPYEQFVHKYDFGYMIEDEDIVAYHIEDNAVYEYIYNEQELCVYINVDAKYNWEYKNFLKYLIDEGYYNDNHIFDLMDSPLNKDDYKVFNNLMRPVIYLSDAYSNYAFSSDLKEMLDERGSVVFSDTEFEQLLVQDIKLKGNCILYPNGEVSKITRLSKESLEAFRERIVYKVSSYSSKRVFDYPYRMVELYQNVINKMIKYSHYEDMTKELEYNVIDLESMINDLQNDISDLNNDIMFKKFRIEELENRLATKNKNPLLFKGDIEEHYYKEQKDIVLNIIKEELKSEKDEYLVSVYNQILDDNPFEKIRSKMPANAKDMNRAELLKNIEEALNMTSIDRVMDSLAKNCGFNVDKNGHNMTYFFGDDQCPVLFASSPSDKNFGWQMLRMVKKVCF